MQFFLGLDHFTDKILFDPSLFVHIRKRLGDQEFDEMNQMIIQKTLNIKPIENRQDNQKNENDKESDAKQGISLVFF